MFLTIKEALKTASGPSKLPERTLIAVPRHRQKRPRRLRRTHLHCSASKRKRVADSAVVSRGEQSAALKQKHEMKNETESRAAAEQSSETNQVPTGLFRRIAVPISPISRRLLHRVLRFRLLPRRRP